MTIELQSSPEKIPIIVVNWNGKKLLSECLCSLKKQTYKSQYVILVDNGSTDGSVRFVKEHYPDTKVISLMDNFGFAAGNNVALRNLKTEYVALLNNDAIADPNWLSAMVTGLEQNPKAGFAASKILHYHDTKTIDRAGDTYTTCGAANFRGRGQPENNFNAKKWIFGASGAAVLYRTKMLRDIGLFDDDFFLIYEDVDLSFRAQLKGYRCLYIPEAIVYHKGSSSIISDSPISVYYGHRNLEWTYFKNMPSKLLRKSILLHLFYNIIALIYFFINGKGKFFLKAKLHALKNYRNILMKRRMIQESRKVDDKYIWGLLEHELFFPRLEKRLRRRRRR